MKKVKKGSKKNQINPDLLTIINLIFVLFLVYDIFVLFQLGKNNYFLMILDLVLILTLILKKQEKKDLIYWGLLVACLMFLYTITLDSMQARLLITSLAIFANVFGYIIIPFKLKKK